ncbi:hypothetical protein ABBQ38_009576 [Trebouxia sp. C0009 RCD-2024]
MHRIRRTPNFTGGRQIRGPMAAEFFGAVAVVFTNLLAFIILLWKTARRTGTGFGYGYVVASYGITGLWLVLVGIVMWAGNEKTQWNTTPHWGHGLSLAYSAAYLLAWITAGIYLLTWAMLFLFRKSFSQPATRGVVRDTEAGMTGAYPATTTYSSPAFVNSPRATPTTASKGRFWRKQSAGSAPLAVGAPGAAATSMGTQGAANPDLNTVPANAQHTSATGTLKTAAAPNGTQGAFSQYHGQSRGDVAESGHNGYPREAEMGPVGPHDIHGGGQGIGMAQSYEQRQNDNRAGFFQSSPA